MAGWKSVEESEAYRVAVDLRDSIGRLTQSGPAGRDFTFRDQIRSSAASTTKNLAEGFERFYHGEFAQFASIAKGSLGETIDALKEGKTKAYFSPQDADALLALAERARKATSGLIRYLRSSQAPGENSARRRRQ
jgi:four helix bundle protein